MQDFKVTILKIYNLDFFPCMPLVRLLSVCPGLFQEVKDIAEHL